MGGRPPGQSVTFTLRPVDYQELDAAQLEHGHLGVNVFARQLVEAWLVDRRIAARDARRTAYGPPPGPTVPDRSRRVVLEVK